MMSLARRHCVSALTAAIFSIAFAAGIACNSDASGNPDTAGVAETPTNGTLTNADGWPRVEGLHGKRYCEVLLARVIDAHLNAEVWNSYGLNECPEDAWRALDAPAIKTERNVLAVLLNGPRYWLMDAIEKKPSDERETTTFGTIEMFRAATVDLGPIPPNLAPYTERHVERETVFEYDGGAQVYELVTADGNVFIMQSYSQQSDVTLSESDLAVLATRLTPPAGWSYRARTLDGPLRIAASGTATVIQDDLSNTYQLIESN
ncbi:MAG TPA: hypothetical protein VIH21_02195 [Dehalococcoidia bacterium]